MLRTFVLTLLCTLLLPPTAEARKPQNVSAEYTYYAPGNVSPDQAKQIALHRARIKALADTFGTTLSQDEMTVVNRSNDESNVLYRAYGGSLVRGEWIADTQEAEVKILGYEDGMLIVRARVWGKAREIATSTVDYTALVLRNGTEPRFESDEFRSGDDLYFYFRTPVSGYLAVYLVDDNDTAYCLLPYMRDPSGRVKVGNDRDYVFFSIDKAEVDLQPLVDEYTLTCSGEVEHNRIYVIFSPNEFIKAGDMLGDETLLPRELPLDKLQRWLADNRLRDPQMSVTTRIISITRE